MVCPACIALPVALGAAITGTVTKKNLILFQVSLLILIISIYFYLYYKYWKKDKCTNCVSNDNSSLIHKIKKLKEKYFDKF